MPETVDEMATLENLQERIATIESDIDSLTQIMSDYLEHQIQSDIEEKQAKEEEQKILEQKEKEIQEQQEIKNEMQENYETLLLEKMDNINNQVSETNTILTEQTDFVTGDFNTTIVSGFWMVILTVVVVKGMAMFWDNVTKW